MSFVSIKCILNSTTNTVYLSKCSNSKESNKSSEDCKKNSKPLPVLTHSLFNYVERSTKYMTVFFYFTEFNRKHTFSILCSSTKKCCNPHPEKSTRTTCKNSSSNTNNVTCTNCCRKGCTKSRETGKFSLSFIFLENALKSTSKFCELNTASCNCHYNTGYKN